MRVPRIYHPEPLIGKTRCLLTEEASHHLGRVLRMPQGASLILFDGSNHIFYATIAQLAKKQIEVAISHSEWEDRESPLPIHLGQVISRGERMEFTIQKSVELGVNIITPLWSARCGVKLDTERQDKKIQQWQKIAIAACEQCGRNRIPEIRPIMPLNEWCQEQDQMLKLNLHPRATHTIKSLPKGVQAGVRLLIGSEGGLSHEEIAMTRQHGFTEVLLGNRILRTETASLATITALQVLYGDLS